MNVWFQGFFFFITRSSLDENKLWIKSKYFHQEFLHSSMSLSSSTLYGPYLIYLTKQISIIKTTAKTGSKRIIL